ncbi:response regulator transcription factor [[Clostridium] symbiosum]|uniref:response regulator transcription factor n=1 Tax=Clostridium symbiosum TaxID=1512 RepID=UPI001D07B056|nr:response regulator transcription factor [[Clostridium] symbiosum]MCB6607272.1 response regulator transcription factor [[Clostridium] symbiosum]MCB6929832.1 response regulator transcription factor [[Clostridium] symbiosum]
MNHILIVEDDREIAENLLFLLGKEGFSAETAATREEALEKTARKRFDLILMDVMLPDGNGYSLCTTIKRETDIPVIFLTAMGDEGSIVTGFDLGADDYIAKPFKPLELISRVKNTLRRSGKSCSLFLLDGLEVDTVKGIVRRNGKEIMLTALEYRLLLVFLNRQGEVLSRMRLLEEIWDIAGDYVNDNTLTVYIKRLREKIEEDPANPRIIMTVRGRGYRVGE